jgi:hypothetical protein
MAAGAGKARDRRPAARVRALLLTLACGLGSAHAKPKLQAVGEVTLGVTDNSAAAPDVPLPEGPEKNAGAFLILRPGLVLAEQSARTLQRLSYTYDYDLYFGETASNSFANRLEYRGFFDISPRVGAVLGAAATQASSYSALALAPLGSGSLQALPGQDGNTLQLAADEIVSFELAPGWRAFEGAGINWATPLFDTEAPRTLVPNARLGLEYSLVRAAYGLEARVEYAVIHDGVRADGVEIPLQQQLASALVGTFRHDLGRYFTGRVEAGVLRVDRFDPAYGAWYPTARAALAYADVVGDAELSYAHTVFTNALLGQSLLADEVRLRGRVPLDQRERFVVGASAGFQTGRLLDEAAEPLSRVSVLLLDAGFGWQATSYLLLGLRGQHIDQRSDTRIITLPVSYVQNTVMLGALLAYPPDLEMPRAYRAPRRVDRTDEIGARDPREDDIPAAR